jgi:2,5-diketo-D-gluconate reductase A
MYSAGASEEILGRAIEDFAPSREGVVIATKVFNPMGEDPNQRGLSRKHVRHSIDDSLRRLGTDYVDLYLIHWPQPVENRYVETWRGFEKVLAEGRARAIGVSNFTVAHLRRLADETGTVPAVDQVELHPRLPQAELREYLRENGIATEAWAPIAQGGELLKDPTITDLAHRHGRSPAQVVLRWHVQLGNIVFPKSMRAERMRENIDVFDFELSAEDMTAIDALGIGERIGPDPDHMG